MDLIYIVTPLLLISVVLAAVWLDRWSVPVIVVALGAGIVFGSDVLKLWNFSDALLTNRVANLALVFILFHGGFDTRRANLKAVALPAGGLATWGVVLTALFTLLALWKGLGWDFQKSCLLAAIISSTDAAAIFSILRRKALPSRLSALVEVESAANDPMAILLTVVAVQTFAQGAAQGWTIALSFLWKFAAGPALGWLVAHAAVWLFNRLSPQDRGHYYVLFLGIVLLTYGLAEGIGASGMLAVFIAGHAMGNHAFVHRQGVANFSAALSTVANVGMFVLMGLLVFPHQWRTLWFEGLILFLVLTLFARPLAVTLSTLGMGLGWKKKLFVMWAGLRGSVPIVLATYPAAGGLQAGMSQDIFNLVFFAVLLSVLVQGSTLGACAGWLGLTTRSRPKPFYNLELITMAKSDMDLAVVDLPGPKDAEGPIIQDLKLPPDAVITLITRGRQVVSPRGQTRLMGWDQVTVLAHVGDHEAVHRALIFPFLENTEH
ncbi:MAG: potassium/proton antiporter [Kiritimatiellae bacterium]|nr:potassium/proton antiporter [Kiritimatiellia bacterium]